MQQARTSTNTHASRSHTRARRACARMSACTPALHGGAAPAHSPSTALWPTMPCRVKQAHICATPCLSYPIHAMSPHVSSDKLQSRHTPDRPAARALVAQLGRGTALRQQPHPDQQLPAHLCPQQHPDVRGCAIGGAWGDRTKTWRPDESSLCLFPANTNIHRAPPIYMLEPHPQKPRLHLLLWSMQTQAASTTKPQQPLRIYVWVRPFGCMASLVLVMGPLNS